MSVHAAPAPGDGPALTIRGRAYPVVLPKLRDPRLQLAATITSLQVIGQVGFHFQVSIAQILISLGTCAVLEIAIALRKQGVLLWPASALLTGNGVAFVLRVPGTAHGDWWSVRGWWIFAGTAAVSLLSKHVIAWRGKHIFNPSNIGLVALLPRARPHPRGAARLLVGADVVVARDRARDHRRRRLHDPFAAHAAARRDRLLDRVRRLGSRSSRSPVTR